MARLTAGGILLTNLNGDYLVVGREPEISDSGTGLEAVGIVAYINVNDSGNGIDEIDIRVLIELADSGVGLDLINGRVERPMRAYIPTQQVRSRTTTSQSPNERHSQQGKRP